MKRLIAVLRAVGLLAFFASCGESPERAPAAQNPFDRSDEFALLDGQPYSKMSELILARREELAAEFGRASGDEERGRVLAAAGQAICHGIRDGLSPHWLGTPWAFSGTTEVPGEGSIACGYFVTTVLRDAGVELRRIHLAQQASEVMIKALVSEGSIRRFSDSSIGSFIEAIRGSGPGLFVVGLDQHTGFILNDGAEIRFLHASYAGEKVVVSEEAFRSEILAASRYRVLGNLTADPGFVTRWLLKSGAGTGGS